MCKSIHGFNLRKYTGLGEAPCVETLFGLELKPNLKWNAYMRAIAYNAAKTAGSL